jgi:nitrous oxide reductase accessory protein NosL
MFIVRKQDILHRKGGASYLVEASKDHMTKYRWGKTARKDAMTFAARKTARTWATRMGGEVIEVAE